MSDLAATDCGCGCSNNGNEGGCSWIIILLLLCCCGNGNSGFCGFGNGCGDSCCSSHLDLTYPVLLWKRLLKAHHPSDPSRLPCPDPNCEATLPGGLLSFLIARSPSSFHNSLTACLALPVDLINRILLDDQIILFPDFASIFHLTS